MIYGFYESVCPCTRQRNSPYGQTIRRSIYDTRWPAHLPSKIRRYKRFPQGPTSLSWYIKPCTYMGQIYVYSPGISDYVTIAMSTPVLIKIPPIDASGILNKPCNMHWKFCAGRRFLLIWIHWFSLDLTHRFRLDLTHRFWLDWTECLQNNPTLKLWNIQQFWELKLVLSITL